MIPQDDEHIENIFNEFHAKTMSRCKEEFMSQRNYYKSVLAGLIVIIGMLTGSIAWAFSASAAIASTTETVKAHESRLTKVEERIDRNHNEIMQTLKDISKVISTK